MARISVLGGTGYAGSNVVREAQAAGHQVTSYSRTAPAETIPGVTHVTGSVLDDAFLVAAVTDADVVVSALSPRGDLAGQTRDVLAKTARLAQDAGVRFGVVGGAGSLLINREGPKVSDTDGFPAEFKAEAAEMEAVLRDLESADAGLDWFYVSPAGGFGPWAAGEATGVYRTGDDLLLVDDNGESNISGADLGKAVVEEIATAAHKGRRFTVAY